MNEEINNSIEDYLTIIKERLLLIGTITLATVIIAGILSFFVIKPTYESSTSIIVGKPQATTNQSAQLNSDITMYQNLLITYSEIAKSDLVAQGALDELKGNLTIDQIKAGVTVTPKTGTQILMITAKGKDPQEVLKIVNAISTSFVESTKKVYPTGGDIQVMDKAVIPLKPISPNKKLNLAIGLFLGLMLSLGVVFLLEYMDNTIKTESDVEKYLGLPVLGVIPRIIEDKK
ncbi:capsular biosynthesis protein [Clostridium estertheticum]|uniref:YveK family protein n=1 Tax=Clostridium estertheticum TaxID=238834 RepID=UPI001CF2DD66|nr:Wzz/FepE/Etk N-terminal domain-containing protein [Clostridium estertheticum]MCB2306049.1 capsular biosynthesis protein [Clostridium estertheticum]MCB2346572.1 capsular biosynthesis protein [Clostridium estertheticum]MCB2348980.1 capsular biosynthesis protein [Clostridium estertheticum]WAG47621.1 capsular biosynthesis protein [Clostridium estertheticum]